VAAAEEQKEQNIRERRLAGRQGLEAALAEYVDFPDLPVASGADSAAAGLRMPRKGMTVAELDASLGPSDRDRRACGGHLFRYSLTSE
jgi:hypothetical protein